MVPQVGALSEVEEVGEPSTWISMLRSRPSVLMMPVPAPKNSCSSNTCFYCYCSYFMLLLHLILLLPRLLLLLLACNYPGLIA